MKPDSKPIDPTKRTEVPQERVLTPPEASLITRVFLVLLLVPMLFEISAWVTPGKTNLLAVWTRTGMQRVLTWTLRQGGNGAHLGNEGEMRLALFHRDQGNGGDIHARGGAAFLGAATGTGSVFDLASEQ